MQTDTLIGIVASGCSIISLLPQLIKLYEIKKAVPQSWVNMIIALSGIILWMGYGIIKNDMIIFGTQTLLLIISLNFYILNKLYLKRRNDVHTTELLLNKPNPSKQLHKV